MKVRLSKNALEDLRQIGLWIAEDNPSRAESFTDELQERCRSLSNHPERFPIARNDIRKLTHSDYLIFYRVGENWIDVLRIIHGSRDWAALLDR